MIFSRHPRYSTPESIVLRSQRLGVSFRFPSPTNHQSRVTRNSWPLSFQSLTNCPFCNPFVFTFMHVMGVWGVFSVFRPGLAPAIYDFSVNSFRLILFRTLLHSSKTQLFSFQANPNSFPKTPGVGYPHFSAGNKMNQTTNNSSSSHDTLRRFHRHPTRSRASPLPRFTSQRDKCLLDYIHPILHMAGLRGHLPLSTRGPRS